MSNSLSRTYMLSKLVANECNVLFTKVDGTERHMRCTLDAFRIPKQTEKMVIDLAVDCPYLTVWDLDKEEWRRFRVDSVKSFVDVF